MELANPLISLSVDIEGSPSHTRSVLSFPQRIATPTFHSHSGISFLKPPWFAALEVSKREGLKETGFMLRRAADVIIRLCFFLSFFWL